MAECPPGYACFACGRSIDPGPVPEILNGRAVIYCPCACGSVTQFFALPDDDRWSTMRGWATPGAQGPAIKLADYDRFYELYELKTGA